MKLNLFLLALVVIITCMVSCKTSFKGRIYNFVPTINCDNCDENEIMEKIVGYDVKSIAIQNDSILEYRKLYGGLSSRTTIKYKRICNELITDSASLTGDNIPNLINVHLLISRDSLINKKTNERYYNQKYIDRMKVK